MFAVCSSDTDMVYVFVDDITFSTASYESIWHSLSRQLRWRGIEHHSQKKPEHTQNYQHPQSTGNNLGYTCNWWSYSHCKCNGWWQCKDTHVSRIVYQIN